EGEKNRHLSVNFPNLSKPPVIVDHPPEDHPTEARKIPTLTWIFGGVALVATGSFVAFGAIGKHGENCAPTCTRGQVDDFRRDFLIADISLLAALASAGAAVYFALKAPPPPPAAKASSPSITHQPLLRF